MLRIPKFCHGGASPLVWLPSSARKPKKALSFKNLLLFSRSYIMNAATNNPHKINFKQEKQRLIADEINRAKIQRGDVVHKLEGFITEKQIKFLRSFGSKTVNEETVRNLTKKQASVLIDQISAEPASPKQKQFLLSAGYNPLAVQTLSKVRARIAISRLTRMTVAQEQALSQAGVNLAALRADRVYLTKKEASEMLAEIYAGA
jgi:hypothetical protein